MSFSVGIVGLPNVGKSTLFKALTKIPVEISNYPFCTIEPNKGIVKVPDQRLEKLAALFGSEKIIGAVVEFLDIAGLVRGAHEGEGLGNQFLSYIRETKAIVHILRCFKREEVVHVEKTIDPLRDLEIVNTELILKDLETIKKRKEHLSKEIKVGKKESLAEKEILEDLEEFFNQGQSALSYLKQNPKAEDLVKELCLLTAKPCIYLLNSDGVSIPEELLKKIKELGASYLIMNLEEELEFSEMTEEEKKELEVKEVKIGNLIKEAYKILDLITFFTTTGQEETRAWSLKRDISIIEAAGVIHTDFREKFIKAEVVKWNKVLEAGGLLQAHNHGFIQIVGKDYLVEDGDLIKIKHQ